MGDRRGRGTAGEEAGTAAGSSSMRAALALAHAPLLVLAAVAVVVEETGAAAERHHHQHITRGMKGEVTGQQLVAAGVAMIAIGR